MKGLISFVFLFILVSSVTADLYYVHPDSVLNTIQAGLNAASDFDTVLVGPATYVENLVWPSTQGVKLLPDSGPSVTVIDGNMSGSVVLFDVPVDTFTQMSGFTIWNGSGTQIGDLTYGGGVLCIGPDCGPKIQWNTIRQNTADRGGGACFLTSNALFLRNTVDSNDAAVGDGIFCDVQAEPTLLWNNIEDNGYGIFNAYTSVGVQAIENFWGDDMGPYHPVQNPGGIGDTLSDFVNFTPWSDIPILCGDVNHDGNISTGDGFTML
jgi:hypothetical protein